MKIDFYKYQGTGNDFVIVDNRNLSFPKSDTEQIQTLCHRKFGIGADGFMLLEESEKYDFKMVYFNSDGNEGSMCGNGGRCIVAFAASQNIIGSETTFEAVDGKHSATIDNNIVALVMNEVDKIEEYKNHVFLNTGSPHHVEFIDGIDSYNVFENGKKIRNGSPYFNEGTNVNFVEQIESDTFKVRTFERGVEDETLSCGTGVTAVAISAHFLNKTQSKNIKLKTIGGDLEVMFNTENNSYKHVVLKGPANFVFKGTIKI